MEEKDIKELWKKGEELDSKSYSQESIEKIMQSKPKDIVTKFIKTLKMEFWFNIIAFSVITIVLFYEKRWYSGTGVIVINALMYIYYSKLIKKLSNKTIDVGVVQYMYSVYKIIKRFILHYKIAIGVSVLPAYFFGIYLSSPNEESVFQKYGDSPMFYVVIIAGLVVTVLLTLVVFHFFYGKKANQIKKMVEALKKEEGGG